MENNEATQEEEMPEVTETVQRQSEPAEIKSSIPEGQEQHIKGAIEAILFVNESPVTLDQIKKAIETVSAGEIKRLLQTLMQEYNERKSGTKIIEIANGYQMLSNPAYVSYVRNLFKTKHKEKLSKPALESIAIIAYKQPVTRAEIELIRGVNSDGIVNHLVNKELIKIVGKKDVPGKPYLYGTTKQFLEYFGLKSLENLPKLEEFESLVPPAEEGMTKIEDEKSAEEATLDEAGRKQETEPLEKSSIAVPSDDMDDSTENHGEKDDEDIEL